MSVHPFMAIGVARACRVPRRRGTCQGWAAAFRELESMDRIEAMPTLLAVVRAGSLSVTSREFRTPIATVNWRIAELEAQLMRRLLSSTMRCLALTDAGEVYAVACRHILERLRRPKASRSANTGHRAVS